MSLKTILVHVEVSPMPDPRLAFAIDLANQFDAKLIGIGAEDYRIYGDYDGYGAAYLIAAETETVAADLEAAEAKFRGVAGAVREGSDWRAEVRLPVAEVSAAARSADLVVTSRSARHGQSEYNIALPGALIMQTGRPVLMTPPGATDLKASSVLVAWRDTREARRAVADAMPFLRRASKVYLVEICDNKAALPAATARLEDVAGYLLRHGITAIASAHIAEREAEAAAQLLDIAELEKADLVVAGAYGHSRFQEWVFGGFTRALLEQTAQAVLFSH